MTMIEVTRMKRTLLVAVVLCSMTFSAAIGQTKSEIKVTALKAGITVAVPCMPPSRAKTSLTNTDDFVSAAKAKAAKTVAPRMVHVVPAAVPVVRKVVAPTSAVTSKQISAAAAMIDRYRHPNKMVPVPTKAVAAQQSKLPHWGDKDCLCHEGLQLFKQGRYMQAAAFYHKAGETMLRAWGEASTDVARARRGEAVCFAAANRNDEASKLFKQALVSYILGGKGSPAPEMPATLNDLCQSLRAGGAAKASAQLSTKCSTICALAITNPRKAVQVIDQIL